MSLSCSVGLMLFCQQHIAELVSSQAERLGQVFGVYSASLSEELRAVGSWAEECCFGSVCCFGVLIKYPHQESHYYHNTASEGTG